MLAAGGPGLAPVYLLPLGVMALAYTVLFGALWLVRIRAEVLRKKAGAQALAAAGETMTPDLMHVGAYAAFIWPAYALTAAALVWMVADTLLRSRTWRARAEGRKARKQP